MAEAEDPAPAQHEQEGNDDDTPGYKAPAKVDLDTIQKLDADDESLVKYKKALLGDVGDLPKGWNLGVSICWGTPLSSRDLPTCYVQIKLVPM